MPVYECQIQFENEVVTDYIVARSPDDLSQMVEARGGALLKAVPLREVGTPSRSPFNLRNLSLVFSQLGSLLAGGIPLPESLRIVATQFAPPLGTFLDEVYKRVSEGSMDLATALAQNPQIPSHVVGAVRAGQASAKLAEVLRDVGASLAKAAHFRSLALSALTYPALILAFAVLVTLGMVVFVVPGMVKGLEGIVGEEFTLPLPTRVLVSVSTFLTSPIGGGVTLLTLGTVPFLLRRVWVEEGEGRKRLERFLLRAPLVSSLYAMSQMAGIARILSTALGSGVGLPSALRLAAEATSSLLYRQALEEVRIRVESGVLLSVALTRYPNLCSTLFRSVVSVGEKKADVGGMVREVQRIYEEDYETRLRGLSSTIEPLLLILVGGLVGGIMVSMLLPYFSVLGKLDTIGGGGF